MSPRIGVKIANVWNQHLESVSNSNSFHVPLSRKFAWEPNRETPTSYWCRDRNIYPNFAMMIRSPWRYWMFYVIIHIMSRYMYVHTNTYIYNHVYIHINMCIYVKMYIHTCLSIHMYIIYHTCTILQRILYTWTIPGTKKHDILS